MHSSLSLTLLAASLLSATYVSAFTNGTLLPPYLCDLEDLRIGGPKSLGDVIPHLQEDDAQMKIAGYHKLTKPPYVAQDLCTASIATAGKTMVDKGATEFIVSSKNTAENLLGLIVWIQDLPQPNLPRRIGRITNPGLNMINYPYRGCGPLGGTIVHSKALDDDAAVKSQSAPFTWMMDEKEGIAGAFVEVRGICVTDAGFGKFAIQIPVAPGVANSFKTKDGEFHYDGSGKGLCPAMAAVPMMSGYGMTMMTSTKPMTWPTSSNVYGQPPPPSMTTSSSMKPVMSSYGMGTSMTTSSNKPSMTTTSPMQTMTAVSASSQAAVSVRPTSGILYSGASSSVSASSVVSAAAGLVALFMML